MLTALIIVAVTMLLLVLAGLLFNVFLYKRGLLGAQLNGKKSPTAQLHELIFQRKKDTAPPDLNDQE